MRLGIYVVSIIFTSLVMPSAALRHDEGNDLGISCKVVKSPNTIHFASSLSMFTSQVPQMVPPYVFFLFCLFCVSKRTLEETTKNPTFLDPFGNPPDFWLPSTPTTRPTNRGGFLFWLGSTSQVIEYPRDGLKEMPCRYLQSHLVGLWRWRRCRGWIWSFSEWRERVYLVEMQQVCSGTVAQKVKISHGFLSPAVV